MALFGSPLGESSTRRVPTINLKTKAAAFIRTPLAEVTSLAGVFLETEWFGLCQSINPINLG